MISVSTENTPSVAGQQRLLRDAERSVESYHEDYARRVIFAWFHRVYNDRTLPFQVEIGHCRDCSSGDDPVSAEFFWEGWGSLCARCSLQRFKHAGRNPRIAENAERGRR